MTDDTLVARAGIEVRPATAFDDVAALVGPKRPDATVCWCLSYRIPGAENRALSGTERGERMRQLTLEGPQGVERKVWPFHGYPNISNASVEIS